MWHTCGCKLGKPLAWGNSSAIEVFESNQYKIISNDFKHFCEHNKCLVKNLTNI